MSRKLDGKVALVTGAGRGIGRAVALKLAQDGARVVVNDLDRGEAEGVVDLIHAGGGEALACAGNVADAAFAERFVAAGLDAFGTLDIVVNNAGYTWDGAIQNVSDAQWYAMIDCHLTGPFRILRAAQPVLKALAKDERQNGVERVRKVVNTSSIAGLFGNAGQSGYSAAKAGIAGLTMTLAKEWGRMGVTVNSVAHGLISTRLTASLDQAEQVEVDGLAVRVGVNPQLIERLERSIPLGRAGTAEEAAGAVYLFCIPESDYVSGQTLLCSGGLTGM